MKTPLELLNEEIKAYHAMNGKDGKALSDALGDWNAAKHALASKELELHTVKETAWNALLGKDTPELRAAYNASCYDWGWAAHFNALAQNNCDERFKFVM